jgi:type IV secretion system protein TrbL
MDSSNLFDSILNLFHNTAHTWESVILDYASWLFWSLALISMVWTFGFMMLRKADFGEFFAELIRFIVTLGFFFWIMDNGPLIASSILDSLRQLAANASGLEYTISPSDIVDVGFDIVSRTVDSSSIWSPGATMAGYIIAGVILVILTLVAMNMLIILISGWIVTYAGIFLLGFGGGRWTQDIAINYYRSILGIALQAFTMILIIGIGKSFMDQYFALMAKDILLKEMFIMLAVAIILLVLVNKIPPMVAGIVQGGGHFGGGGGPMGGLGLSGAMGAAGVAAGMATTGAGNVASQAAGGLSALQTAFKAAAQTVGADAASNVLGQSATSKLGGLANAMGQASTFASSFGAHLASGMADVAQNKKDAFTTSLSQKVSQTAGGKVASSISAKMDGDATNANQDQTQNAASSSNQSPQSSDSGNVKDIKSNNGDLSGGVGEGDEINLVHDNNPNSKEG